MKAEEGEYWCPNCHEKVADDYQEMTEKCGYRGRRIWLCPTCHHDIVRVDNPVVMCPFCDRDLVHSIPDTGETGHIIECPEHGQMHIDIFPNSFSARKLNDIPDEVDNDRYD